MKIHSLAKVMLSLVGLIVCAQTSLVIAAPASEWGEFKHPGVFLDVAQIEAVRKNISDGSSVTMQALQAMQKSPLASLDYQPKPWAVVECGSFSKPDLGCTDESNDAQAAYTHALLWAFLHDERHARKAVEIMDAWSSTLTGGHTNSNAPLQASWNAQLWPRTAEIIRYTTDAWSPQAIARFETMLRTQYLPNIVAMGRCHVFNWQASAIEARANIAIFTNDRAGFDEAIGLWPERARSSLYLTRDGAVPLSHSWCPKQGEELIKDWFGQRTFVDGHAQETCRDLEHTAYGLAALINVAETARIQGVDLYGSGKERLMAAMEYHARLKNRSSVPDGVCGGTLKGDLTGTMEVGYNHYVGREGNELPETSAWLNARRPMKGYFHYLWETMTHAQTAPSR